MSEPLRVLIVEDSEDDALLVVRHLTTGGRQVEYERVETPDAFLEALARRRWDIVIADSALPQFGQKQALALLLEVGLDLPFILVSGTIGEDEAVAAMKEGAHDYIMKGKLARLGPAVERELREAVSRKAHRVAEQKLREREAYLRAVTESVGDGLLTVDESGRIESFNPAAERIFGISASDAVGLSIGKFVPTLEELVGTSPRDLEGIRRDGSRFPVSIVVSETRLGSRRLLVAAVRDVTERKTLERQLVQSQRMESIGTLAGGIAHDFNNILTGILTYATLGLSDLPPDHALRADLEEIAKQTRRAASLVRQLLAFSRRQILEPRNMNLNEVIRDLEKFLRRVIGEQIDLKIELAADLYTVYADPTQVEQVLMNLCVNARDAMPNGGRLVIETKNIHVRDTPTSRMSLPQTSPPGDYACIRVSDNGTGIGSDTLQRIFEPFFTTKEPGRGTGLGLSVVYGIVKQHDGMIDVDSDVGRGTTFGVYFPAVRATALPVTRAPVTAPPRGGGETLLLAEDDPAVRNAMVRVLGSHGYNVLTAADGSEALRVFEANADRIGLVMVDLVMPRLGGRGVYDALRDRKPGLKFLFVSGYSPSEADRKLLQEGGPGILQKPFDPDELARRVRDAIDRPAPAPVPNGGSGGAGGAV